MARLVRLMLRLVKTAESLCWTNGLGGGGNSTANCNFNLGLFCIDGSPARRGGGSSAALSGRTGSGGGSGQPPEFLLHLHVHLAN